MLPAYLADYEQQFDLRVHRPVSIRRVESHGELLAAIAADGSTLTSRALIDATGTWTRPLRPSYPGRADFRGRQLHTHDYRGPEEFDGARLIVIGGGISAVQLSMELAPHTAEQSWLTRAEPVWVEREFTTEFGREAVAVAIDRVRQGLPPQSVVSVTGLGLSPAVRAARASGVLRRESMFSAITPTGVHWQTGTRGMRMCCCRAPVSELPWTIWHRCTCVAPAGASPSTVLPRPSTPGLIWSGTGPPHRRSGQTGPAGRRSATCADCCNWDETHPGTTSGWSSPKR